MMVAPVEGVCGGELKERRKNVEIRWTMVQIWATHARVMSPEQ